MENEIKQNENDQENNKAVEVVDTPTETKESDFIKRSDLDAILKEWEKTNKEKWEYMDARFDGIIKALKPEPAPKQDNNKEVKNTDLFKN